MMNEYELSKIREIFSRLFVLAIKHKMNLKSFTFLLGKSTFINKIEKNIYDEYFDKPIEEIFNAITGLLIENDDSYGIYNDAYWAGYSYFNLYIFLHKNFAYLFLKLPLDKMLDIYSIFHEMDVSALIDYFNELETKQTILRILCTNKHCSLRDINIATSININTLMKYNACDESLYNGSFQNIIKLALYFDVPISLFMKENYDFIIQKQVS